MSLIKESTELLNEIIELAIDRGVVDYDEYYYSNGEVIISISELKEIIAELVKQ